MHHPEYSSVDPETGNVTYRGPLELTQGDHSHMPPRTPAFCPGDEKGHVNASSLGGGNGTSNVIPQHRDVNHGAYYSMEQGERAALAGGATIQSEKTAVVNDQPGDRPEVFMVTDTVTYPDGHTETIHHSFANEAYAEQSAWKALSAALPDTFEAPNPADGLRDTMGAEEYAQLMEATDAELPAGIAEDYAPADFSGPPMADAAADTDVGPETDEGVAEADRAGADAGTDAGADASPDPD